MKPTYKFGQLLIAILSSFYLAACGGSKIAKNNESLSSRQTSNESTLDLSGRLADCNAFRYDSMSVKGIASAYYENGIVNPNKINLRLLSLPTRTYQTENYKIELHLWGQENGSSPHDPQAPVQFAVQNIITGEFIRENYSVKKFTEISKSVVDYIVGQYSSGWGITSDNFLQKHILVLYDTSISYDAINIGEYPISGGSAVNNVNFLLPQFYADPQVYINTHDSALLQEIHPLYGSLGSGWSDEVYYEQTENWCNEFMKESPSI